MILPTDPSLKVALTTTVDPTLTLQRQVTALETANKAQVVSLQQRDQEITALKTQITQLQQQTPVIQQLTAERDSLRIQMQSVAQKNDAVLAQMRSLQTTLAAQNARVAELANVAKEKDALQNQLDALKAGQAAQVPLSSVISDTSKQLEEVQQRLKSEGRGFRLGKIAMDLKVLPTGGGTDLMFMRPEDLGTASAEQLSTIKIEFNPTSVPSAAEAAKVALPNVIGYTLILARRKLAEFGLAVDVSYQAVTAEPGKPNPAGRVVEQWPKPSEPVDRGSRVSIAIGKPIASAATGT